VGSWMCTAGPAGGSHVLTSGVLGRDDRGSLDVLRSLNPRCAGSLRSRGENVGRPPRDALSNRLPEQEPVRGKTPRLWMDPAGHDAVQWGFYPLDLDAILQLPAG